MDVDLAVKLVPSLESVDIMTLPNRPNYMVTARDVWYVVADGQGRLSQADLVEMSSESVIAKFRDAVYAKNSAILPGIVPLNLEVYANKATYDRKEKALGGRVKIGEQLGKDDELYVVVPALQTPHDIYFVDEGSKVLKKLPRKPPNNFNLEEDNDWTLEYPGLVKRLKCDLDVSRLGFHDKMGVFKKVHEINQGKGTALEKVDEIKVALKNVKAMELLEPVEKVVMSAKNIDVRGPHLPRQALMKKLVDLVRLNQIVLLTSPAGSGKTSILTLFQHQFNDEFKFVSINCKLAEKEGGSGILQLQHAGIHQQGIDVTTKDGIESAAASSDRCIVFILDDAQAKYGDIILWEHLFNFVFEWDKTRKFCFVISATHQNSSGSDASPPEFSQIPPLRRSDFILSPEESRAYLALPFAERIIKGDPILQELIVDQCGGLIGALYGCILGYEVKFRYADVPTGSTFVDFFLSKEILGYMQRCFGHCCSSIIGERLQEFLKRCLVDNTNIADFEQGSSASGSFLMLQKAGILVEDPRDERVSFTSTLAKRYCFEWIFPKADRAARNPETLAAMVESVVGSMSCSVLKQSTVGSDFPKEAVFQQLFMQGIVQNTTKDSSICPEMSKIYPNLPNAQYPPLKTSGEIDFFVNGQLRWGIELLVKGSKIGEHLSRFSPSTGKYFNLDMNDFAVVDFRHLPTLTTVPNVKRHPKRITVCFETANFLKAMCVFGDTADPIVTYLSP